MARDVMYYFDKKSPYTRYELGEIQSDFNMGLTIDGSKDSMQVQIYGYVENEITPNTILFHSATNTWWVVRKDIVKRYANESTYWFTHNLTIVGAIELLNVRDLTDCGFNDDTYTIDQFKKRLFKLSTFEFPLTINYGNNVDENKLVDYIKSFENYTLLSALREFLNGYNCDAKLTFNTSGSDNHIDSAILNIIPRTGNVDLPQVNIDEFDDIRETKTINKESYGTTVISNAQNVVSTLAKTYPQVGGVKLSADNYSITPSNAILRLPTPIYKVNWIKILHPITIVYTAYNDNTTVERTIVVYPWNNVALDSAFRKIAKDLADTNADTSQFPTGPTWQEIYDYVMSQIEVFFAKTKKASTITIDTGWSIKPVIVDGQTTQELIAPPNNESFRFRKIYGVLSDQINVERSLVLGTKDDHDAIVWTARCMYYERGGNEIHNFNWTGKVGDGMNSGTGIRSYAETDLGNVSGTIIFHDFDELNSIRVQLQPLASQWWNYRFGVDNTFFQVNYIPMSDLKIKYDNSRHDIDSNIYNQNGKLNDSVAISKLIDSHSKEIQSDNITRYMHYTNFADIPQVGTLVNKGNEKYVINNISYDFYVNETNNDNNIGYYIECEFTMSKYVSTKSLMVNPNSNIRDYGIPQKFNVKRKQTYRDFYEFSLTQDSLANQEQPYVQIDNYIDVGTTGTKEYDHTAIIKVDYENELNESKSWFYQLNTTAYVLSKELCEVIDFKDNNIIGYDLQNVWTGFNMSKLFSNNWKATNIPISYVDENGRLNGITLEFVNKEKLNELYENISLDTGNYAMFSSHVFVGSEFYYGKYNYTQVNNELNSFSTQSVIPYVSTSGGITTIKIPLSELDFDNTNVDLDSVVINDVSGITYIPRVGNALSGTVGSFSIITEDGIKYLQITDTSGNFTPVLAQMIIDYDVSYRYATKVYDGAIDIKDYEIKELDYDKDAIEVPVFEYILQLGDTEEVEVGERILDTQSGMLQMYTCDVRQANTTTQLNASKVFSGLEISGDTLTDDNYDRQVEIADTSAVDISFENNNTIMRIKVYDTQTALFYGNADQDFDYQNTQVSQVQKPKSYLLGKDIVIYKNVIKSMTYDIDEDVATCDYDNELMFIIHNPQDSNFDGDDLLVNVNYYKLK